MADIRTDIADALDEVHNAAIGESHAQQEGAAFAAILAMSANAVASHLRECAERDAKLPDPDPYKQEKRPDKLEMVLIVQATSATNPRVKGYGLTTLDYVRGKTPHGLAAMLWGRSDVVDTWDCIEGIKQHIAECDAKIVSILIAEPLVGLTKNLAPPSMRA